MIFAPIPFRSAAWCCALILTVGIGGCGREASRPAPDLSAPVQAPRAAEPAPVMEERVPDVADGAAPASLPPEAPPRDRMVHYDGNLKLQATSPRQTIDEAVEMTTEAGGYVETLEEGRAVLRVPVARFQEVFDRLVDLGDVLSRSVTARDITEAYTAADLRLRTARAARERLRDLLDRAENEEQKISLLREIQRLTVEIDQIESRLRHLESLAEFSRITLEVRARQALAKADAEELSAFRWIRRLDPFERTVAAEGGPLEMAVPEGMVELDQRRRFVAESADGTVFWASERENRPRGSTEFWIEALETRLAPEFAEAELLEAGEFRVLRLVGASGQAYRYLVGVRTEGDELELVEAYFPGAAQEERHGEAVLGSIAGGEA